MLDRTAREQLGLRRSEAWELRIDRPRSPAARPSGVLAGVGEHISVEGVKVLKCTHPEVEGDIGPAGCCSRQLNCCDLDAA